MTVISPNHEQQHIISQAQSEQSFKIMAYAGSGKTTTLTMVANAMPSQKKGLYLAFNKAIADHAKNKFPRQVDARTFHSMAYRGVDGNITKKLSLPRLSPSALAKQYGLNPVNVKKKIDGRYERFVLTPNMQASLISDAVSHFCTTSSRYPQPRHIHTPDWMHDSDIEDIKNLLYPWVERRWLESTDARHEAGIGHDIYLKLWALSNPVIQCDYILFDEAQDSDPIMLGVLLQQKHAQLIFTGDAHQQIYGWRGAVNAMQQLPLDACRLTQSFRFGPAIADVANIFLSALGENIPLKGTDTIRSVVYQKAKSIQPNAILCRTNAKAMELLVHGTKNGKKVALQADKERLKKFVTAAGRLKEGGKALEVPELSWFNHWQDVLDYCETSEGSDLKTMVKLVDEHGVEQLTQVLSKTKEVHEADFVISTAHKAKGLEWSYVSIEDDFQFHLAKNEAHIKPEELRLLYVACTRAQHYLAAEPISDLVKTLYKTHHPLKP